MNGVNRPSVTLLVILASALAVRLAYLYLAVDTPLFDVLLIDSEFYDRRARAIASGDWLGDTPFFMNPFYPYFLAVVYALFDFEYWMVGMVQAVVGTGSCYLIYLLGSHIWRERVGIVAAGLAAVYGPYVFYDGALLTAAPITFLNLAGLYFLLRSQKGSTRWLWGAGIALGFSATARPMVLLFVVVAAWWFLQADRIGGLARWGRVLAGCALVVGAVVVRNYAVGGEWLLTTSSAGMNFYVGNHPGANGIYAQVDFLSSAEPDLERAAFIREAERRTGRMLSPGEASRFWLRDGLRFVWDNPQAYFRLLGRKLYMFWNGVEAQNNLSIYLAQDFVPLLRWLFLGWGVLAPLALVKWVLTGRQQRIAILDLYFLAYLAGCLLFFVSSEYRLPVVPVLLLYAAHWLIDFAAKAASGAYRPLLNSALLVCLVGLPINYRDAGAERLTRKRVDYYNFGTLYQRRGDLDRAEEMYRQALRIDPNFAPARSGLGSVLSREGRDNQAAAVLGTTDVGRGLTLFGKGEYLAAIKLFNAALARGEQALQIYNNIGLCHYRLGKYAEAIDHFDRALAIDPQYGRAYFNLGLVHVATGDDVAAEVAFARVLALETDHAKAHYRRGASLARLGRRVEAEAHWAFLTKEFPGDGRLLAKIDSITQIE